LPHGWILISNSGFLTTIDKIILGHYREQKEATAESSEQKRS
jgi:hypothetical protein